jgi:hypothetical protein
MTEANYSKDSSDNRVAVVAAEIDETAALVAVKSASVAVNGGDGCSE